MTFIEKVFAVSENRDCKDYQILKTSLLSLKDKGLKLGLTENEISCLIRSKIECEYSKSKDSCSKPFISINFALLVLIFISVIAMVLNGKEFSLSRCIVENNYFVMEITRPITDCKICKNIESFTVLENVTKNEFAHYAYLGHPLLVKGGCSNWSALDVFDFDFLKALYEKTPGAYRSVEDECQFFPFRTTFLSLQEVFNMPEKRAKMTSPNVETWYIGW